MSIRLGSAAQSLQAFGLYLAGAGLLLLTMPALLLAPLGLPVPGDVWIRVAGLLAIAVGVGDVISARGEVEALLRWSIWRRAGAAVVLLALVALAVAPPALLLFAAVDAGAAAWTAAGMRSLRSGRRSVVIQQ